MLCYNTCIARAPNPIQSFTGPFPIQIKSRVLAAGRRDNTQQDNSNKQRSVLVYLFMYIFIFLHFFLAIGIQFQMIFSSSLFLSNNDLSSRYRHTDACFRLA